MSERDPSAEGAQGPDPDTTGTMQPAPPPDPWAGTAWTGASAASGAAPSGPAAPAPPPMAWAPPPAVPAPAAPPAVATPAYDGAPPPFTIGALLADTFARYGADPLRLFALGFVPAVLGFLATFAAAPTTVTPSAVGTSALLSLLSAAAGIIGTSVLFALIDGGRAAPFGSVLRQGFVRSGWILLTLILFVLILLVAMLVAAIPAVVLVLVAPPLAVVFLIVAFLAAVWLSLRLYLALPGVVADNLNTIDALRLSWRITRPAGVWLRILGAALVLGLLIGPASIASSFLVLVVAFVPIPVLLLVVGLVLGFLTPFTALLTYSAYRRLVPPAAPVPVLPFPVDAALPPPGAADPTLAAAGPAVAWTDPAARPPAPAWRPASFWTPPFGSAARVILAITLVLGVGGLVGVPIAVGQLIGRLSELGTPGGPGLPGIPGLPVGNVPAGTVAFGTSADLVTCTIEGQLGVVPPGASFVWLGSLTQRVRPSDDVTIRVTLDGLEFASIAQPPGSYDCLGTDELERGLPPGTYTFQILVNGQPRATGTVSIL